MEKKEFVDELKEAMLDIENAIHDVSAVIKKIYRDNIEIVFKILIDKHDTTMNLDNISKFDKIIQEKFHNELSLWNITRYPDNEDVELSYFIGEYETDE